MTTSTAGWANPGDSRGGRGRPLPAHGRRLSLLLGCLAAPFATLAHHGAAPFDQSIATVIEGSIAEYKWGNPHVYFSVRTTGPRGEPYVQEVEAGAASLLLSRGVTRELLHPGDRVSVRVNPNRRGEGYLALGVELTVASGRRYPLNPSAVSALGAVDAVATGIQGTWVPQPAAFSRLSAEVRTWPATRQAQQEMAGDRSALFNAQALKCVPQGAPYLMAYSVPIRIQTGKAVTIDIDWSQTRRVVHLGATHPANISPSLQGHSIGHWEGKVLVVDTVGFTPHPQGLGFRFPSSTAKHIVERFALSEDRRHLDYEVTVEDPTYLTAAITARTTWDYRPGQALSNAPCDPASARRFLTNK